MIKIIPSSILLLIPIFLFGQFSFEEQDEETQKLVNKYECFFRTMEDQNRLFKIGFSTFSRVQGIISNDFLASSAGLEVGLEQRVATGYSFQFKSHISGYTFSHFLESPDLVEPILDLSNIFTIRNSLELRKYFGKKQQIHQGLSGNNLSGFYMGLQGEISNWTVSTIGIVGEEVLYTFNGQNKSLALTGGWQYQFGKKGFINFHILAGNNWQDQKLTLLRFDGDGQVQPLPAIQNWFFDYRLSFGWAFGRKKEYAPADCSIIQYFEEERSMWKFDLLNLLANISDKAIAGSASIEYERKIGNLPFSINPFVSATYTLAFDKESDSSVSFVTGSDFRYYYNLKNSDNLSYGYGLMWGFQRRLFKSLYVDYQIGYQARTNFETAPNSETLGDFFGQFKIGVAF